MNPPYPTGHRSGGPDWICDLCGKELLGVSFDDPCPGPPLSAVSLQLKSATIFTHALVYDPTLADTVMCLKCRHTWTGLSAPQFDDVNALRCFGKDPRTNPPPPGTGPMPIRIPVSSDAEDALGYILGIDLAANAKSRNQVSAKPCTCPMHGPDGLMAVGCKCGALSGDR